MDRGTSFVDIFGTPSKKILGIFCSQSKTFVGKVWILKQSFVRLFVMGVFICTMAMEDQDFFSARFGFKASSCREFMLSFYFFCSQPYGAVEKNIEANLFQCIVGFWEKYCLNDNWWYFLLRRKLKLSCQILWIQGKLWINILIVLCWGEIITICV